MSLHRFFLAGPLAGGGGREADETLDLPLSDDDRHHLRDVLRLGRDDEIVVVTADGQGLRARLSEVAQDAVRGSIVERLSRSHQPQVTLVQGVPKGHKMDDVVSGAVEVGVAEIRPVLSARTVTRLDATKRQERAERWARVAQAAAKQAQRSMVPTVAKPTELDRVIGSLEVFDGVLVLWEEASGPGVRAAVETLGLARDARVAVVVGPEGGLTADEVRALERVGGVACSLGPTVLRTQTAGVVATALVIHELGGLGNDDASGAAAPGAAPGARAAAGGSQ